MGRDLFESERHAAERTVGSRLERGLEEVTNGRVERGLDLGDRPSSGVLDLLGRDLAVANEPGKTYCITLRIVSEIHRSASRPDDRAGHSLTLDSGGREG